MADESNWTQFCAAAATILRDAQANKISLEEASNFFENSKAIADPDLRQYVERMVWEIDSEPGHYTELVDLFESRMSQQEILDQLNLDEPLLQRLWNTIAFWRRSKT